MRLRLSLIFLLCLLPLAARAAFSPPLPRTARLDHRLNLEPGTPPRLDLRLKLPVSDLVFRREGGDYRASLRVAVKARRKKGEGEASLVRSETLRRPDFKAARDRDDFLEREYALELSPGRWDVELQIFGRGPSHPWVERLEVEVPRPGDQAFYLQGPVWLSPPGGRLPSLDFCNAWNLPERVVLQSDGFSRWLELECELSVWESGEDLEALLELRGRDDRLVHYERRSISGEQGTRKLLWRLPVEDLSLGPYRAEVVLRRDGQEQKLWAGLEMGLGPAAFGRDWRKTLELLAYHADAATLERLEAALPERRLPAFLGYWEGLDNRPDDPENPALEAFFAELSFVGREYGSRWQPGWRSDRGRIRLDYGPPLRIDEIQDDLGIRRREIWTYPSGLVFVFESDQVGQDFRLVERWDS